MKKYLNLEKVNLNKRNIILVLLGVVSFQYLLALQKIWNFYFGPPPGDFSSNLYIVAWIGSLFVIAIAMVVFLATYGVYKDKKWGYVTLIIYWVLYTLHSLDFIKKLLTKPPEGIPITITLIRVIVSFLIETVVMVLCVKVLMEKRAQARKR
jgi:hypothetical protein